MPQAPASSLTVQPPTDRQGAARFHLASLDAYATTLLVIFVDTYGIEGLSWSPQTIKIQVEQDFGVEMPKLNLDRLLAAVTLVTTNYFYKSLSRFIDLCNVLAGDDFDPGVFNPADATECAWGVTEAMIISPPDEPEPFVDDIRYYVGAVLQNEGFVKPPDVLRIAINGDAADRVSYDWADDPEMFSAIYDVQTGRAGDVEQMLRSNLGELFNQIKTLPLENGDASGLLARLGDEIRNAMKETEPEPA